MVDRIDDVLRRAVASEVEPAPAAPSAEDIAGHMALRPTPRRSWSRPVLAVAAVVALLVAGAVVLTRRHDTTVAASSGPLPAYFLPSYPEGLQLISARESATGAPTGEPTIHVFQRVNSDPEAHQQIVVVLTPETPGAGDWTQLADGAGELHFRVGDQAAVAFTRTAIPEADLRAFAAGLRLAGPDRLDPDSGGDFATIDEFPSTGQAPAPPSTEVMWWNGSATLTLTLTTPPSGVDTTLALPEIGSAQAINRRAYISCRVGDTRTVSWLDSSGTWIMLTGEGDIDLDHVNTSMRQVSVADWRAATGLQA